MSKHFQIDQYHNVMIDIETMGTNKRAVIASIAAVEFDLASGQKGRHFYEKVDIQSCLDLGLQVDGDTIKWWLNQPDQARAELVKDVRPLPQVLFKLTHWMAKCSADTKVWGNGPSFDLVILGNAFQAVNQTPPWDYKNERCVRTMLMLFPMVRDYIHHRGIKHQPVADANYQIELVSECYRLATPPQLVVG
ncbi:MAG: 3'-5' exoribonuclease [Chitinophagaceae bacterium]|nr:3'-5' exoribonuclease [Chitinophagaceae bacterium]